MKTFGRNLLFRSDVLYAPLRRMAPILRIPSRKQPIVVVSRYDDAREVLQNHRAFNVPYQERIRVIMGGANIFLGMDVEPARERAKTRMQMIARREDAPKIAAVATKEAEAVIERARGDIDVVEQLTQAVTVKTLGEYFGAPAPTDWRSYADKARLLFEFQFVGAEDDYALRERTEEVASWFRNYIQGLINEKRAHHAKGDDVLARCVDRNTPGGPLSDTEIRSNLIGFLVGGLPQPPMIIGQLMEVLLNKPLYLAKATEAARMNDDDELASILFEALRFYPLTPGLRRECTEDTTVAFGTKRQTLIKSGSEVIVLMRSAMHDPRVWAKPNEFDSERKWRDMMHFGFGPHECFGVHINSVMIPAILKPLLARSPKRVRGPFGHLIVNGVFSKSLHVNIT